MQQYLKDLQTIEDAAQAEYENAIAMCSDVEPMTGRLARESLEKAMTRKGAEKPRSLTTILFRSKEEDKPKKPPTENASPVAQEIEDNKPVSKLLENKKVSETGFSSIAGLLTSVWTQLISNTG
jgi:hypothetical protein